jgi:peptide deformylase
METLADRVERKLSGARPLPLVVAGDPVLRNPASAYEFSLPDDLWSELIEAMFQTMRAAPGVGLAAPQIGLGIRVAVLEDPADVPAETAAARLRYPTARRVLVNPDCQAAEPSPGTAATSVAPAAEFYEGCLSVPGYQAVVRRSTTVRLRCSDEYGSRIDELVTGWAARIVAHETDHLDGVLYLDRAQTRSLASNQNLVELWAGASMADIRHGLRF